MVDSVPSFTAKSRLDFRRWLARNHEKEKKVAIVLNKRHTGVPAPSHRELMEEAICFGWIDTTVKRLDEDQFIRYFTKRSSKSKWSDNTLGYAKQLIKRGKMTPVGLKFYREGLSRPTHDHGIPKNPDMPAELRGELEKNKVASANFEMFSPSAKRTFYMWILRAKREETRAKRIGAVVETAREKRKAGVRRKDG